MPADTHEDIPATIETVTQIFDDIEAIESYLSALETRIAQMNVPAGVEDQLRAVDEQLFGIKQQLSESWGVRSFTEPVVLRDELEVEIDDLDSLHEGIKQ